MSTLAALLVGAATGIAIGALGMYILIYPVLARMLDRAHEEIETLERLLEAHNAD